MVNASVEFDLETLRPTFHLTIGLPGRSNALAIAQRLGMPETVIAAARAELDPSELRAEDLLDEIHRQRDLARRARDTAEKNRHEAERLHRQLEERLEGIEDERRNILEKARQSAEDQVQELQEELRQARRLLTRARQPLEVLQEVEEQAAVLEEKVERPVERLRPDTGVQPERRAVRLGDKVRLRNLGMQGVLITLGEEEGEVQLGALRVRARLAELELASGPAAVPAPAKRRKHTLPPEASGAPSGLELHPSPGIELDLRGQTADEALDALDRYLDFGLSRRATVCTHNSRQGHRQAAPGSAPRPGTEPARALSRVRR